MSRYTGSSASVTGSVLSGASDSATSTARRVTSETASAVRSMPGRKSPRAFGDDAHAEADGLALDRRLQLAIAGDDDVAAEALDPEIRVGGAALFARCPEPHRRGDRAAARERWGQWRASSWNPVRQYTSNVAMDIGELHHLLFRWLHVVAAMVWIGHTWSLVFAQPMHQPPTDTWIARLGRRHLAHRRLPSHFCVLRGRRADDAVTVVVDGDWRRRRRAAGHVAAVRRRVDAASPTGRPWRQPCHSSCSRRIAQGLAEFMTGRAVFIHVGGDARHHSR